MRVRRVLFGCSVLAFLAFASVVGAGWSEKGRKLVDALVVVECAMGAEALTDLQRAILARARREGVTPPYSHGWCLEQDIVPSPLMENDRES